MSANPTSFRLPAELPADVHPAVKEAVEYHDSAILDLQQAIPSLKAQITALQTTGTASSGTATTSTTTVASSGSEVVVPTTNSVGFVNNQSGVTAYLSQQSDYGSFVLLSATSAIAVGLGAAPAIQTPFFCVFVVSGTNSAVLTPQSGTINGGATFTIAPGQAAEVVFDGASYEAILWAQAPQTVTPVAGEYLTGYNAGVFSVSTPAGIAATVVLAKITTGGANGSLTVVGGLITAYVAPS